MRRRLILPLVLIALASPALAAEEKKPSDASTYVDLSSIGLPTTRDGRLANYVFVQVRILLRPGASAARVRLEEPYLRDALVRAAHRTPFSVAGDPNRIDEAALRRAMTAEAARIAGPGVVAGVQVVNQQPTHYVPKG
jgi:hypothetical protein